MIKILTGVVALAALAGAAPAAANLLVNGNFEASTSQTSTPTGWTNIGHTEGVISYASFGTPAYDGDYYYDIGGYGGATPAPGEGISQTVTTVPTALYTLTFGFSGENTAGVSTVLDVLIGSQLSQFTIVGDGSGVFKKPFQTTSINYLATGASTTISFTIASSTAFGFNDPLIDGVSFALAGPGSTVPEPASWAMLIAGFGLVGAAARRRRVAVAA
ncbi:PEPxxWA-CTERM sorting domain-containing protein [Sandarakinorhabdus sp. DWP1-3-1]|uniref:PEPxxWA-CTERM sorting domain-containing protein n=1 Tax=Sandarakinorhabdus sp. DWP1-3-1 TaxID=2804627 RepID=UPI003CEAF162